MTPDDRSIPTTYEGTLEPNYFCRAWNAKRLKYCSARAGAGTDHPGAGRCRHHGGRSGKITHGRYSKIKRDALRELIEAHAADPDPLDILPELAAARALFQDFVERYDEWRAALLAWHASFSTGAANPKPHTILDIGDAYRIVSEITKIVERIEKIRAANAITLPDLERLMHEMGRILAHHVPDETVVAQIREGWLALRV